MISAQSPGNPAPSVVVLIVAFNAGLHLQRCIDALERQTFSNWEAIVWDNASSDGSIQSLKTGAKTRVIVNAENIGFAAANNRASLLSKAPFIVALNPDAFAEPEWLERLINTAETTQAESIASLQLSDNDPTVLDGAGDCMSIAGIAWRGGYRHSTKTAPTCQVEVFSACAAAALYRRDAFEALNGFEERFFCYYEDVDLGFRIRLAGGRCILEPRAVVRHVGSASSGSISGFSEYYGTRNRFWTFLRDMPTQFLPVAIPAHFLIVAYVLMRSPTPQIRAARWRGLKDAWAERKAWLGERRNTKGRAEARIFSWSPSALAKREIKVI